MTYHSFEICYRQTFILRAIHSNYRYIIVLPEELIPLQRQICGNVGRESLDTDSPLVWPYFQNFSKWKTTQRFIWHRRGGFVCHIFGSVCHIFCRNPLILTNFYAIRTPIVWQILQHMFCKYRRWGWSEWFSDLIRVGLTLQSHLIMSTEFTKVL